MARRQANRSSSRSRGGSSKGKSKAPIIIIALCVVALLGIIVWMVIPSGEGFTRKALDKYVENTQTANLLGDGASVYVDMSDGMLSAYASDQAKTDLQAVINKLAANKAIQFYELGSGEIKALDKTHTALYNYMLDSKSYKQMQAPIEKTLEMIVDKEQPALLMSDFEEYNGGRIQNAAYAKKYFIEWLAKGYNITFYKWDFTEGKLDKHMYLAVFDDNAERLNALVNNALVTVDPRIETYVLGSRDYAYPMSVNYPSLKQGGNYHNGNGKDVVTAVLENGGTEDYVSYAKPYASSTGEAGQFAPLDQLLGTRAEYYPIGVSWEDAINNSKMMQEAGVKDENLYTHLLSNLYVDFGAQDGFTIDGIEIRVFDVNDLIAYVAANDSIDDEIATPELNGILTAGMEESSDLGRGWQHIYVDFDEKFDGKFTGNTAATDLLRANIVISKATPNIAAVDAFFGWEGNPSLSNSVREALTAGTSNPAGRILYTYYIRTVAE